LKDYPAALKDFDQAIVVAPRDAAAWVNRGRVQHRLRDFDAAIRDLEKAMAMAGPGWAEWSTARLWLDDARAAKAAAAPGE